MWLCKSGPMLVCEGSVLVCEGSVLVHDGVWGVNVGVWGVSVGTCMSMMVYQGLMLVCEGLVLVCEGLMLVWNMLWIHFFAGKSYWMDFKSVFLQIISRACHLLHLPAAVHSFHCRSHTHCPSPLPVWSLIANISHDPSGAVTWCDRVEPPAKALVGTFDQVSAAISRSLASRNSSKVRFRYVQYLSSCMQTAYYDCLV